MFLLYCFFSCTVRFHTLVKIDNYQITKSAHATILHQTLQQTGKPQYINTAGYHGVRTQKHKKYSVKQIPKMMMYLLISFSFDCFTSFLSYTPTPLPVLSSSRIALHAHVTTTPHTHPFRPHNAPVTRPSDTVCWFWPCEEKILQPW